MLKIRAKCFAVHTKWVPPLPTTLRSIANDGRICISAERVAEALGINKSTVWSFAREEGLPIRILRGRITRFVVSDVTKWMARRHLPSLWHGRGEAYQRVLPEQKEAQQWLPGEDLNYDQVAHALDVSLRTVFTLRKFEGLPVNYRGGGNPYVYRSLLIGWILNRPVREARRPNPAEVKEKRGIWRDKQTSFADFTDKL